jgi:IS30 family transposase
MARRELTVQRHEEIKRRLAEGRSVREIASALSCSRRLVREIRDGSNQRKPAGSIARNPALTCGSVPTS